MRFPKLIHILTAATIAVPGAASPIWAQVPLPLPKAAPSTPPPAPPVVRTILPALSGSQRAFLRSWLASQMDAPQPAATRSDEALIRTALDEARALRTGRLRQEDFLSIWAIRPTPYDPLPDFARAVEEDRLVQWAAGLTPPYAGYDGLQKGLVAYTGILGAGGWPSLTPQAGPDAIRARLAIEDKAVTPDETLTDALQRAQRRYGLKPTGLLNARTLAALNVPVQDRIAAIEANMERWRWLPRDLPVNRVQVNIAAAVLTAFEGDRPVASMRAVTGRPGNETPMLVSSIHSIVVNPPWNVPSSIAKRELWPKGRAALLRQGYKIVRTPEGGERIVQPAGPASALGQLKFDFDNPFAVYLHDTPARAKFASYDRLASHGCVRLEHPLALAELMMKDDPRFGGQMQATIDTGKTQRVTLPRQVAVYLLYWTAFASANGTMSFRDDPYGWDKLLASKVDAAARRPAATMTASR